MGKLNGWRMLQRSCAKSDLPGRPRSGLSVQSQPFTTSLTEKIFFKKHSLMRNAKSCWFGRGRGGETFENVQEKDIM